MKKLILPIILASVVLAGCGSSYSDTYSEKSMAVNGFEEEAVDMAYDDYDDSFSQGRSDYVDNSADAINDHGKKLVHTYNINVQTTEYDIVAENVSKKIEQYNGYVESSNMDSYSDERHLSMTIRIPQENATAFLEFVGESTNVKSQSESATDKTLEYVDIDSRMNSYKQELEVMEDLAKRAETVTELLEIENNIAEIRGQIDSYQSQLNTIDNKVSYATIYLDINEVTEYTYTDPGFFEKISSGLSDSFDTVGDMFVGFIVAIPVFLVGLILFLIPAALIIFIITMIIKAIVKSANSKNNKKVENINTQIDSISAVEKE